MSSPFPQTISWGLQCPWTSSHIFCLFSKGPSTTAATGRWWSLGRAGQGWALIFILEGTIGKISSIIHTRLKTYRTIVFLTFLTQWLPKLWRTRSGKEKNNEQTDKQTNKHRNQQNKPTNQIKNPNAPQAIFPTVLTVQTLCQPLNDGTQQTSQ